MLLLGALCLVIAALVLGQVRQALPVYFIWLLIAGLHIWYSRQFALMPPHKRPLGYHSANFALLVADFAAHVAVAVLCRVGWVGVLLLILAYFCFGRLGGLLAMRYAIQDILRILAEREPEMDAEERAQLASIMLEQRRQRSLTGW
jgi:hypothetical protein